jgi:hypothetical protein
MHKREVWNGILVPRVKSHWSAKAVIDSADVYNAFLGGSADQM